MNKAYSKGKLVLTYIPQGLILSLMLYSLYIPDLLRSASMQTTMYAEDIYIFAKSCFPMFARTAVQTHLDKIETWSNRWGVNINSGKMVAFIFTKKYRLNLPIVRLHTMQTTHLTTYRYLGRSES